MRTTNLVEPGSRWAYKVVVPGVRRTVYGSLAEVCSLVDGSRAVRVSNR